MSIHQGVPQHGTGHSAGTQLFAACLPPGISPSLDPFLLQNGGRLDVLAVFSHEVFFFNMLLKN